MILNNDLKAFLEARTVLPNPDRYNYNTYTVSVGCDKPAGNPDAHIYQPEKTRIFVFRRQLSGLEIGTRYDWISTDLSLQEVIFDNQIFAALMVYRISVTI